MAKCGSLLKTLFVYGMVALFLVPVIYETYNKIATGKSSADADYELINTRNAAGERETMTPEEMAKRV